MNECPRDQAQLNGIIAEIAAHQKRFVSQLVAERGDGSAEDTDAATRELMSKMPDIAAMAAESAAANAVDAIVQEALVQPVAQAALEGIIDDCLARTLEQTGFAEALVENLMASLEGADLGEPLSDCVNKSILKWRRKGAFDGHLDDFVVTSDFETSLEKRMAERTQPQEIYSMLDNAMKEMLLNDSVIQLLGERFKSLAGDSPVSQTIEDGVRSVIERSDNTARLEVGFDQLKVAEHIAFWMSSPNVNLSQLDRVLAHLRSRISIESFKFLPKDTFIARTAGSLADESIDQPSGFPAAEQR